MNVYTTEWYNQTLECWINPVYSFDTFHMYYQLRVGFYVEEALFCLWTSYTTACTSASASASANTITSSTASASASVSANTTGTAAGAVNDKTSKRLLHTHAYITALLALSSFVTGYAKIGSLSKYICLYYISILFLFCIIYVYIYT